MDRGLPAEGRCLDVKSRPLKRRGLRAARAVTRLAAGATGRGPPQAARAARLPAAQLGVTLG
jgi:hypothetical protein